MNGRPDAAAVVSRPVLAGDRPFLVRLYADNRAAELDGLGWDEVAVRVFMEQQYRAREAGWAWTTPDADDEILFRGDEPVGRLVLDRRAGGIHVVDIALLPSEQGLGLGTTLLTGVAAEADRAGMPVTLQVVAGSRAVRLYERLGFRAAGGDDVRLAMERPPRNRAERTGLSEPG